MTPECLTLLFARARAQTRRCSASNQRGSTEASSWAQEGTACTRGPDGTISPRRPGQEGGLGNKSHAPPWSRSSWWGASRLSPNPPLYLLWEAWDAEHSEPHGASCSTGACPWLSLKTSGHRLVCGLTHVPDTRHELCNCQSPSSIWILHSHRCWCLHFTSEFVFSSVGLWLVTHTFSNISAHCPWMCHLGLRNSRGSQYSRGHRLHSKGIA